MPRKQKILLITLEYPPVQGGIARYLENIYSQRGGEDLFVLASPHQQSSQFDQEQKYKIFRKDINPWWAWPRWQVINWYALYIYLKHGFSEIHLSHILPVGYVALFFKKLFRIPYTIYTHGMDILLPQKSWWKRFWLKKILNNAARLIANSEFTKNEIVKLGTKRNVEVKYPCVKPLNQFANSRELANDLRLKHKLGDKKIILSVGRLVARKGFDRVIEAMPRVLEQIPEAIYVIVGHGPFINELQATSYKLQAVNNVIFINTVSDQELHAWYELCDIFIMPARQIDADVEGFGIVFLEAALHGKPAIGGSSGGIPEAIEGGKTGILVDPEKVDEIARELIRLLKDNDLRIKMGEAAKEQVLKSFIC